LLRLALSDAIAAAIFGQLPAFFNRKSARKNGSGDVARIVSKAAAN